MRKIDINVDLAEGFAFDDELLKIATSANVCCGAHAGDSELTEETVANCRMQGVRVGAHPGVPDRENMGRAPITEDDMESVYRLMSSVEMQINFIDCDYVKLHGSLYNATTRKCNLSQGLSGVFAVVGRPMLGLPGTYHESIASTMGIGFIREGFADRLYLEDGTLAPRSVDGSVLSDPEQIADQVIELAKKVDSICVHGDSPGCVEIAELVRKTLEVSGYEVGH